MEDRNRIGLVNVSKSTHSIALEFVLSLYDSEQPLLIDIVNIVILALLLVEVLFDFSNHCVELIDVKALCPCNLLSEIEDGLLQLLLGELLHAHNVIDLGQPAVPILFDCFHDCASQAFIVHLQEVKSLPWDNQDFDGNVAAI